MDKNTLYRFFSGVASYEEEVAICNWAEASNENMKELIKERRAFDLTLFYQKSKSEDKRINNYRKLNVVRIAFSIAASIALLIGGYTFYKDNMNFKPEIAFNKIVVPPGQRVNLTLSDGTNIWLNSCTEMLYPSTFSKSNRTVKLKGEAYFDVEKNDEIPFIVQTKNCDIKVLGTKFNLQSEDLYCDFSAALFEGSIELISKNENDTGLILYPMQKIELINGKFTVDSIRDMDSFRWKEGLICFENMLFTDLMKRFERIYDIQIIVKSEALNTYRCSGKFRINDGVDFVLKLLQNNKQFKFIRNADNTIIHIY